MKRLVIILLALCLCLGGIGFYFLWSRNHLPKETPELPAAASREETFRLDDEKGQKHFTNRVQGYRLTIPAEAQLSFDATQTGATLTWPDGLSMEIMKAPTLPRGSDADYYVRSATGQYEGAVHSFTNTVDHRILFREACQHAGFSGTAMAWDRTPLSRVANDRPHYYSVDLELAHNQAITFLCKSATPIGEEGRRRLDAVIDSYKNGQPEVQPFYRPDDSPRRNLDALTPNARAVWDKYFTGPRQLRWGIFDPSYAALKFDQLGALEKELNTRFPFIVHYIDPLRSDPEKTIAPVLKQAYAEGRTVELTIQTVAGADGSSQVYAILNGQHDAYFQKLAEIIRNSKATVLLRIGNEMNGDWCTYSPAHLSRDTSIYQAFYRYIVDFFEKDGAARQMLYVWNPNAESFPDYPWNDFHRTWPGNRYVDICGLTAYNNGTYYGSEKWRSFDELYRNHYEDMIAHYPQPKMITEFASSSIGGDKVAWVKDMLRRIEKDYPEIRVAIWWHHADYDPKKPDTISRPYFIDQPEDLKAIFRTYFSDR